MCDRSERLAEEFRPGDDKSQKVNSEISVIWDKLHLTDAHEDEAPLWMMLLHWLLAIGMQFKTSHELSRLPASLV